MYYLFIYYISVKSNPSHYTEQSFKEPIDSVQSIIKVKVFYAYIVWNIFKNIKMSLVLALLTVCPIKHLQMIQNAAAQLIFSEHKESETCMQVT